MAAPSSQVGASDTRCPIERMAQPGGSSGAHGELETSWTKKRGNVWAVVTSSSAKALPHPNLPCPSPRHFDSRRSRARPQSTIARFVSPSIPRPHRYDGSAGGSVGRENSNTVD